MREQKKVTAYRNLDLDETGVVVRSNPCGLSFLYIYNVGTSERYVKVYNKATAATSADTPVLTLPVPARSGATVNLFSREVPFTAGISLRATTGVADNDTGAPGTNEVIINLNTVDNAGYL